MITFVKGNLLSNDAQALVNTVNTVGVMGKGIALMFKEAFPANYEEYTRACKQDAVEVGRMFVTDTGNLFGPRFIINFPTKKHWRNPSRLEWIRDGLQDLKRVLSEKGITSVAIPPLGCGNGGLDWEVVRGEIEAAFRDVSGIDVRIFAPTSTYQNQPKASGLEKLTPARALMAELVRRYWILGIGCTILEVQKLAWFLERSILRYALPNVVNFKFQANKYGPFSDRLRQLLDGLDGSYLHCEKRLADAGPLDLIWFDDARKEDVRLYLESQAAGHLPALEETSSIIDGFESPLGMELLATVDWLISQEKAEPTLEGIRRGIEAWPAGPEAVARKKRVLEERLIEVALSRLSSMPC